MPKTKAQLERDIDEVLAARNHRAAKAGPRAHSTVPSQADYERRERAEAQAKLREIEKAPLAERKEAAAEFFAAMRDQPEIVAQRVGWLLDGNYGQGSWQIAKQVLASKRSNRTAALTQLAGAFEWQSPEAMTRAAWNKLSKSEQTALDRAVREVIAGADVEA